MPLTAFQQQLLAELAHDRSGESYLAGGAALHFSPDSARFSDDLDFFHDSEERVARTFATDRAKLTAAGYTIEPEISQPGFVRAIVSHGSGATRVDWAHDSAWRFMPLVYDTLGGLLLHPIDLAVNKALALAGRDEARDFVDIMYIQARILPLGALAWAAVGKDPGFTPLSLLELLKRRGRYHDEDFARLNLGEPFDLAAARTTWRAALDEAERFAETAPASDLGCLYYSMPADGFVMPSPIDLGTERAIPHFGRPGGVTPRMTPDAMER